MTYRSLFREIMHYGTFDRAPVIHWHGWDETMERWYGEGLPRDRNIHEVLGTHPQWLGIGANLGLRPAFEEEVLEETDEYRIFRGGDGVVLQDWKHQSCIPHYIDYTFKTAAEWPEFKKRLQPDPRRLPKDLAEAAGRWEAKGWPLVMGTGSLMGWTRNWMGVENMSYLMYDDPDCYADIVDTIADLTCWAIDQIAPHLKSSPDMGFGWEDICGKSGPLVSPDIFDRCVAPGYRKIRNKLEEYGTRLYGIDSDGMVEPLVGHWLEAGVNVQFPIERGTWQAFPEDMRRKFGKELRIIGGYDKLALEKGREAIDAELQARLPLMKEGGYILMPDHLITPGVPLDDYKYFIDRLRDVRL
jgi:uroporphyrinogen decarboxylase